MAFDKAGSFILQAARRYRLEPQTLSAMVCTRARVLLADVLDPFGVTITKFGDAKLLLLAPSTAVASELYLRTHEIEERLQAGEFPTPVRHIQIRVAAAPKPLEAH